MVMDRTLRDVHRFRLPTVRR
ncbi:MAG: hypothetical protein R3E46_17665 [Sedimenticolaceae bacterium]